MGQKALSATSSLTEMQMRFVHEFVERGEAHAAARAAGYAESSATTGIYPLLNTPHIARAIAIAMRQALASGAPIARAFLQRVVMDENCRTRDRIDAAKTLLDRAGYISPKAKDEKSTDLPLHELSTDDLRTMAAKLEDEIAGRAKAISATPAPDQAPPHDDDDDLIG